MTALEIAKEVAKNHGINLSNDSADHVLWEHTGFPSFWDTQPILVRSTIRGCSEEHETPEGCLRRQLEEYFSK